MCGRCGAVQLAHNALLDAVGLDPFDEEHFGQVLATVVAVVVWLDVSAVVSPLLFGNLGAVVT